MDLDDESCRLARDAVLRFARDWTAWETRMAVTAGAMRDPGLAKEYAELIETHLTRKKRAYVDGPPTSFQQPPTYAEISSSTIYAAELVGRGRVHVDTSCGEQHYRFVVRKTKAGWRIDSLKSKLDVDDEWQNELIGM